MLVSSEQARKGHTDIQTYRQAPLLGEMNSATIHRLLNIILGEDYPVFVIEYD